MKNRKKPVSGCFLTWVILMLISMPILYFSVNTSNNNPVINNDKDLVLNHISEFKAWLNKTAQMSGLIVDVNAVYRNAFSTHPYPDNIDIKVSEIWDQFDISDKNAIVKNLWQAWSRFHIAENSKNSRMKIFDSSGVLVGGYSPIDGLWAHATYSKRSYDLLIDLPENIKLQMVFVPGGTLIRGSKFNPPIQVLHIKPFYISKFELTQRQWEVFMEKSKYVNDGDNHPIYNVTWDEARQYIYKLSRYHNKEFRMLSEAEWEYACEAGSSEKIWLVKNAGEFAHCLGALREVSVVGQKRPNKWGVYDMLGNAYEWCEDVWHDSYDGVPSDGAPWVLGGDKLRRVVRGSESPLDGADYFTCTFSSTTRWGKLVDSRHEYTGVRLALDVD